MIIQEDTRQKTKKNADIRQQIELMGHVVLRSALPCGDYQILGKGDIVVDTKQGLQEVYNNVIHDNVRFKNECKLAQKGGIKLFVLVSEENINSLNEVSLWKNPRREKWFLIAVAHKKGKMLGYRISKKPPVSSEQLQKAMQTMSERYGVQWAFCDRERVGEKIIEILTADN